MPKLPQSTKKKWIKTGKKPFSSLKNNTSKNRKFYNRKVWKDIRDLYYKENPLCKWCEEEGLVVPGDVVDHIKEINDGGEKLDINNLQTLCHKHHNQKTSWERKKRNTNTT